MNIHLLLLAVIALLLGCVALLLAVLRRQGRGTAPVDAQLALVTQGQERGERSVREKIARSREKTGREGHLLRAEVRASLKSIDDRVFKHLGVLSGTQSE